MSLDSSMATHCATAFSFASNSETCWLSEKHFTRRIAMNTRKTKLMGARKPSKSDIQNAIWGTKLSMRMIKDMANQKIASSMRIFDFLMLITTKVTSRTEAIINVIRIAMVMEAP